MFLIHKQCLPMNIQKRFFCIAVVLFVVFTLCAQQRRLIVWTKDGSQIAFHLNEQPVIKTTLSAVFITTATAVTEYEPGAIDKLTFDSEATNIRTVDNDTELPYRIDGKTVEFLPGAKDLHVSIYRMDGQLLYEINVEANSSFSLSLDELGTGQFILKVNDVIFKVLLQ